MTGTWLRKRARKRLAKADAQLEAALETGDPEGPHEARKSYKKARYAIELAAGTDANSLVRRLKELQDVLGLHQDALVAAAVIKELADESTAKNEQEFGLGVLYAHQQQRAAERLAAVPEVFAKTRKTKVRQPID